MEELKVIKFLLSRVENKIKEREEYLVNLKKADELAKQDEENGKKHTYWERKRELGCISDPCSKAEVKDTLRLIRKLTMDMDKKLK